MGQSSARGLSGSSSGPHTLIGSTHTDTSGTPARGDIFVRSAAGLWVPKTLGASGTVLRSDGTDPQWAAVQEGDITDGSLLARLAANETVAGTWDFTPGLKERGRTTPMGEWIQVAYDAGNFSSVGGGTWTVGSGDQLAFMYTLIGKTMLLIVSLDATSISGTVTRAVITIPGGYVSNKVAWFSAYLYDNSSAVFATAGGRCFAGGTTIHIQKSDDSAWAASANNTYIRFNAAFEVQ